MEVVKVRRAPLEACLTCPLCRKLLQDATTISECLHTFCRKCIYEKFTDEEMESCPTCRIDLGCSAVEKLRPDHSLQDVMAKLFPLRKKKVNTPDVTPITLTVRRKERSLSSLGVGTPRVASHSSSSGRRTKPAVRKPSIKKEENIEENPESSSSPETLNKATQSRRESSSSAEPSNHFFDKSIVKDENHLVEKAELWKPLNDLVDAANRTKSLKYNPLGSVSKTDQINGQDGEVCVHRTKNKDHSSKLKSHDEKGSPTASCSKRVKRVHGITRKRTSAAKELCSSAQALLDASIVKREWSTCGIWFSLMASTTQEVDVPLPQIPACYLRIKDGNLPASFIQKYLAKKLDLSNEAEVDITCRGQLVDPTLELHKLVDLWLQTGSSQKSLTTVGASAKDFVMVLNYARKLPLPS